MFLNNVKRCVRFGLEKVQYVSRNRVGEHCSMLKLPLDVNEFGNVTFLAKLSRELFFFTNMSDLFFIYSS